MSKFLDMVAADNVGVFLNLDEFAKKRTIIYDGVTYADVPCVVNGFNESERTTTVYDHSQGLYRVTQILHCRKEDLGGFQPEQGSKIQISDEDVPSFFLSYYVAASNNEEGMLRVELEAISE